MNSKTERLEEALLQCPWCYQEPRDERMVKVPEDDSPVYCGNMSCPHYGHKFTFTSWQGRVRPAAVVDVKQLERAIKYFDDTPHLAAGYGSVILQAARAYLAMTKG